MESYKLDVVCLKVKINQRFSINHRHMNLLTTNKNKLLGLLSIVSTDSTTSATSLAVSSRRKDSIDCYLIAIEIAILLFNNPCFSVK